MLEHLVLLKMKEGTTDEQYQNIITSLKDLPTKVAVIQRIRVGKNFSDRSQGYTIGLSVTLKNKAALEEYRFHPDHVHVLDNIIKPCLEDVIAVDFADES